jgi:methyl-accepting chemotaxis protein
MKLKLSTSVLRWLVLLALLPASMVIATQEGKASGARRATESGPQDDLHRHERVVSAVIPILNEVGCDRAPCKSHKISDKVLSLMDDDLTFAEIERTRRAYYLQMGLLALGTVVVTSVLLFLLIRRWFGRPVALLVEGTRQIAAGDLDHRIPELDGELGELARAVKRMQEQLKSTRRQT